MKRPYIPPEMDMRRYELTETISASGAHNDDGEIDLTAELTP